MIRAVMCVVNFASDERHTYLHFAYWDIELNSVIYRMFHQASGGVKQWCAYASELRLQDISVRLQNVNINADVK